jgi:hypothetical protein
MYNLVVLVTNHTLQHVRVTMLLLLSLFCMIINNIPIINNTKTLKSNKYWGTLEHNLGSQCLLSSGNMWEVPKQHSTALWNKVESITHKQTYPNQSQEMKISFPLFWRLKTERSCPCLEIKENHISHGYWRDR